MVWIGCGSVVEVCDFGLDRLWVDNGGLWFWFGSAMGRWRFMDFGLDQRGGFALVWAKVLWACCGLSKGFLFLMKMPRLRDIGKENGFGDGMSSVCEIEKMFWVFSWERFWFIGFGFGLGFWVEKLIVFVTVLDGFVIFVVCFPFWLLNPFKHFLTLFVYWESYQSRKRRERVRERDERTEVNGVRVRLYLGTERVSFVIFWTSLVFVRTSRVVSEIYHF